MLIFGISEIFQISSNLRHHISQLLIASTYIYTFWNRESQPDKSSRTNEPPKNDISSLFWCFKNGCFSILVLTRNYHYKTHFLTLKSTKIRRKCYFWRVHNIFFVFLNILKIQGSESSPPRHQIRLTYSKLEFRTYLVGISI